MSNVLDSGLAALARAEEELRELIARAAAGGEYDSVPVLTRWARTLRSLLEPDSGSTPNPQMHSPVIAAYASATPASARTGRRTTRAGRKRSGRRPQDYPKFLREGDQLVKIGWSRTDKAPYEHKAPRPVLASLANALVQVGRGGKRFTTDEIIPLRDNDSGAEIPTYQVYLGLAWLRTENLVVQHGRQGYSLLPGINLVKSIDERFAKLVTR